MCVHNDLFINGKQLQTTTRISHEWGNFCDGTNLIGSIDSCFYTVYFSIAYAGLYVCVCNNSTT